MSAEVPAEGGEPVEEMTDEQVQELTDDLAERMSDSMNALLLDTVENLVIIALAIIAATVAMWLLGRFLHSATRKADTQLPPSLLKIDLYDEVDPERSHGTGRHD